MSIKTFFGQLYHNSDDASFYLIQYFRFVKGIIRFLTELTLDVLCLYCFLARFTTGYY